MEEAAPPVRGAINPVQGSLFRRNGFRTWLYEVAGGNKRCLRKTSNVLGISFAISRKSLLLQAIVNRPKVSDAI
jgi:hypothetical protein